jgi:formamidopyrimidine-DNA glycosylase
MPELPELQAHAERLTEGWGGNVLRKFTPLSFTAMKTAVPPAKDALDHPLVKVDRRGKYLLLDFEALTFAVHLMQGGRLKPDPKQAAKVRGGIARWVFDDRSALMLTEAGKEHRAGVWTDPELATAGLGPEADQLTAPDLAKLFGEHSMRVHKFLRDQGCIAGLGRRLANEVCHRAKVSPFASTTKLGEEGAAAIVTAIRECVDESLAYERTRADMSSSADRPGGVHHRTGQPCPVCGDMVREVSYSAYTVNYCPTCQTGGKVLADNTTSKFLK